jgi:hypothetical protein
MGLNHTHYDNLKVSRNAPPEVIKAAYEVLLSKFCDDPSPDAQLILPFIREAYKVLSNPKKRAEHDAWIDSRNQSAVERASLVKPHINASQLKQSKDHNASSALNNSDVSEHAPTEATPASVAPVLEPVISSTSIKLPRENEFSKEREHYKKSTKSKRKFPPLLYLAFFIFIASFFFVDASFFSREFSRAIESTYKLQAPVISDPVAAPIVPSTKPNGLSDDSLVVFNPTELTWIDVTDAEGKVLLKRGVVPGEFVGVSGALPLSVIVGRSDVTRVLVSGGQLNLVPFSQDNVARFKVGIAKGKYYVYLATQYPRCAGSLELSICEALEAKISNETPSARAARRADLEADIQAAREAVIEND